MPRNINESLGTNQPNSHRLLKKNCRNCGSTFHSKHQCQRIKIRRCYFCRRRGVRTNDCHCRIKKVESIPTTKDRFEEAILLTIEGKRVRAVINTGIQETRIGQGVMEYVRSKRSVNLAKRVIRSSYGLETLQVVTIFLNCMAGRELSVECYIDPGIRRNEMVIGMQTMMGLGYRITVAGFESRRRRQFGNQECRRTEEEINHRDDDLISFLDEDESRRIREWRD